MKVFIDTKDNVALVRLEGELDHHSSFDVREKLEKLIINKAIKELIVDLSCLSFMDSSGIGVIIGRYKTLKALGGKIKIVCKNNGIKKIIVMSGISSIIDIYDELNEAVKNI